MLKSVRKIDREQDGMAVKRLSRFLFIGIH